MSLQVPLRIIEEAGYGIMATCAEGKPRCRPMAFVVPDGEFRLWSSTFAGSGKAKELRADPAVEVCFLDGDKVQLRISGTADLSGSREKKERLLELNPRVAKHFSGPDDPNFVHIEIVPSRVRWMPPGFGEYTEVPLSE